MSIIRTFGELAQEFLEQQIEEFELELATSGTIDPHDEYAGHYYGLDAHRDAAVDGIQSEDYSGIYTELNDFLHKKNITLKQGTPEYMVLARRFLLANIKALGIMMRMCQGKSYEYTNKQSTSIDNKIIQTEVLAPIKDGPEEKNSTYNTRVIINEIATRMRKKYPTTAKYILADDIATELKDKHKISKSARTILRSYSTHF